MRTQAEYCRHKLEMCVRHAREWRRWGWQLADKRERRIHRQLSAEAMRDAREWRDELAKAT